MHPVCYPETVTYNGTEIRFYRETRLNDYILMANGLDISQITDRIKTIGIKVSGVQRDAYQIEYDNAPFSNASRLTRISRFGRNATIAANGTISGGVRKIVQAMTYENLKTDVTYKDGIFPPIPLPGVPTAGWLKSPDIGGDLDFDGKDELYGTSEYVVRRRVSDYWDTTYYRYLSVTSFKNDGTVVTKQLDLGQLTNPDDPDKEEVRSYAGRFVEARPVKDFGTVQFFKKDDDPPVVTANAVKPTTSFDLQVESCDPTAPVGYAWCAVDSRLTRAKT